MFYSYGQTQGYVYMKQKGIPSGPISCAFWMSYKCTPFCFSLILTFEDCQYEKPLTLIFERVEK